MIQKTNKNNTEYEPLQPDWAKEPTFKDLNEDLNMAQGAHDIVQTKLDEYKEILEGGKPIRARVGKSTVRPRLARKNLEWKVPALEEPFLNTEDMFRIKGRTHEDTDAARQNETLLNYYWATRVNKVRLIGEIARTIAGEGTVFVKNGWYSQTEDIEVAKTRPVFASPEESLALMQEMVMNGQMDPATAEAMMQTGEPIQTGTEEYTDTETRLVENHPTYEVCDNTYIIVDPTCEGILEDAQFIIHEYEIDLNRLMKQKYKENEDGTSSGIYKNLDSIDFETDNRDNGEYVKEKESTFIFNDKARKKVKVYEYWGYWDIDGDGETTAIVATWIGDVMVRLEENPFSHGKLPFSSAAYMPVKKELHGEPDAELLKDNQETIGKLTRAFHDITSTQAIGQTLINEQFFSSPSQWDAYKKGNDARFRADMDPNKSIFKQNVEPVSPSLFQGIDMANNEAESVTGTKAFTGGISGQALGSSVGGIRSALDATSKRELSILRRVSTQLIEDMARMTVQNIQAYASEEEVVRITNEEFITIRREDLKGEFDLKIDVSTPEKDNETADKLNTMMQTNAASMDQGEARIVRAKIARLWKMPDLAKHIEEFKAEPDPVQQKIQEMQMQNMMLEQEKLKMEIGAIAKGIESEDSKNNERDSRAAENIGADIANKKAQEEERLSRRDYYLAMAAKAESETDVIDSGFLAERDGTKRQEKLDDDKYSADLKHESEKMKYDAEDRKQILAEEFARNKQNPNREGN